MTMELPNKLKILFVDDESNILEGLKRVLRSKRKEWDMHFCKSAKEALEFMAKNPVEIIIFSFYQRVIVVQKVNEPTVLELQTWAVSS